MRSVAAKFLLPVGLLAALLCGLIIHQARELTHRHIKELMDQQTALALEFDLAIRSYIGEQVRPWAERHAAEGEFVPETMSTSFAARCIFEKVRKQFPDYIIKFSSDNPRNPANLAGPTEQRMIDYFNAHPDQERWSGHIAIDGKPYLAHFYARRMKPDCLRCHGEPADAPASLVHRYGDQAGFHRPLGRVIALDTVAIPVDKAHAELASAVRRDGAAIAAGLAAFLAAMVLVFRRVIARRLALMRDHFRRIARDPVSVHIKPLDAGASDEIGQLASSFNALALRLKEVHASLERKVEERTRSLREAHAQTLMQANKLHAVMEGMEQGVVVADANDLVTDVNAWFLEKMGLTRENVVGRPLWDFHPGPGSPVTDRLLAVLDEFRSGRRREKLVVQRDLLGMHLSLQVQPILEGDCYHGVVLNAIDVTDLVRARQAAEAANQAKSAFLANTSHEIRTPMTAILGFAERLLEAGLSEADKMDAAETILRNGEHLLQIINDILDISKIEAGKLITERIRFSPLEVVADVQSLMQARAKNKGLSFEMEYVGPIPETIESDPTRLKQILVNLIGNAIKFTERGGVRVVTRYLDGLENEPRIQFEVMDTGIGLTREQLNGLFEAFAQGDASTTRRFGGTGLGLIISQRLARLLGGDLTAESEPGKGSTFRVTIGVGSMDGVRMVDKPAQAATICPPKPTEPDHPHEDPLDCHVLLVEDGLDNQRLISFLLVKAGARVTLANNGREALARLASSQSGRPEVNQQAAFDLVLMDMQMPEMDGYQATRLLRQRGYQGPIIALTAHAMATDRDKCLQAGCDDYVSKPINRNTLLGAIRRQLRGASEKSLSAAET